MGVDENDVVVWPKRFKPLPPGYRVIWMGSHYMWVNDRDQESPICWDAYRVRRWAFDHAAQTPQVQQEGDK